jgi:hypothetical protein
MFKNLPQPLFFKEGNQNPLLLKGVDAVGGILMSFDKLRVNTNI